MTLATPLTILLLIAGCTIPPRTDVPPPPAPRTVSTCVVSAGRLAAVQVDVEVATGDTTFQGRPFRDAFPVTAQYAQDAEWQVHNEPLPEEVLPQDGARGDYIKFGRPVTAAADALLWVADHHGVGVYAQNENGRLHDDVLYVPVRPGCWFQRYMFMGVGEVREG
ncbi:MAG TPA: hypothetical protein VHG93_22115 [Longimicrobium sp.]|nr:hypothetical protein [Longimicrobium sp.]